MSDKNTVAEKNFGLVHACCKRFSGKGIEYDELFSAGCLGLAKAINNFDESLNFQFSTYAFPVIMGEIKRLFRDGGTVKVSRSLKELAMTICKINNENKLKNGTELTVSQLAERLDVSQEKIVDALNSIRSPLSLTAEYDEEGNPKLLAGIKYTPIPNGKNYKIVSSLGPVTLLAPPSWMRRASTKVGDSTAITQYYEKAANAVAKTHYGKGMVATAALTVNIVYSYLSDYYNKIGEVAEIDLSSVKNGYGTQMDKLYGRLIGVNYQITADSVNFNAQCSLTFDCVCNREEHRVFGVSSDDMLCAPKKK